MTSDTFPAYSGLAAAEELDELLTASDFEPTVDVDTVALDATLEALDAARDLVARLTALREHLAAGRAADEAEGLAVEVAFAVERVSAITAAGIA